MFRGLCLFLIGLTTTVWAAPPTTLAVQGRLQSAAGLPAPDGTYGVNFSLWDAEKNGSKLWEELHTADTAVIVKDGTFWARLGKDKAINPKVFIDGQLWLEISVTPNPPLARRPIDTTPYALIAGHVACSGCIEATHLNPNVFAEYAKTADLPDMSPYAKTADLPDLTPYAKTADLPDMTPYAKIADLPDLSPYAKIAELPDLGPYAKTADLPDLKPYAKTADLPDLAPYAKTADLPDLSPYAKTADLPDLSPYAKTASLAPYAKTSDIDGINTTLGYIKSGCPGCVAKDMIDPVATAAFEATTTSLPWSAITDKPAGFADNTDNGLSATEVVNIVTKAPINLAAASTVSSRPISTRLSAVKLQVKQGQSLDLKHNLATNDLSVTGWYKNTSGQWTVAGLGTATTPACNDCGTGADGVFSATSNVELQAQTYNYSSFSIAKGVTVTVTGATPLIINVKGNASIAGTLQLSGQKGSNSVAYNGGTFTGGAGGGGGGAKGGDTAYNSSDGKNGNGTGAGQGGKYGSGAGGGGGGGGHATVGQSGGSQNSGSGGGGGGGGGNTYNSNFDVSFSGGSGGGGGGYGTGNNAAGGGGGGGGGAVKITASSITVTGSILCNGGKGGTSDYQSVTGGGDGGGGGGGSGGAIWLRSPAVSISGTVQALGGAGGISVAGGSGATWYQGGNGGAGGDGRIQVDATTVTGVSTPKYTTGVAPTVPSTTSAATILQPDNNTVRITNLASTPADLRLVVIH